MSRPSRYPHRTTSRDYRPTEPETVRTMSVSYPRHLRCPLIVLSITSSQLSGDQIADQVRDELLDLLERSGTVNVVLDLKAVSYLSSAGIRPLLSLVRAIR